MAVLSLPNWITLFRLILVPLCFGLAWIYTRDQSWIRWAVFAGFVVAALSDWLDGYLARRLDLQTRLGAILDPIADKLLVNSMIIILAINDQFLYQIPMTILGIVILRDLIVLGGAAWIHFRRGPIHPIPRLLGKATTLINCATIAIVLAELPVASYLLWLMGISNFLAGLDYLCFGLRDHPVIKNAKQEQ